MQVQWTMLHPEMTLEHLGLLPDMLDDAIPDRARDQFDACYQHGGGWRPSKIGWEMGPSNEIIFRDDEGDEVYQPLAEAHLRDEHILFYNCSWVVIKQPDGSFEVARMD